MMSLPTSKFIGFQCYQKFGLVERLEGEGSGRQMAGKVPQSTHSLNTDSSKFPLTHFVALIHSLKSSIKFTP